MLKHQKVQMIMDSSFQRRINKSIHLLIYGAKWMSIDDILSLLCSIVNRNWGNEWICLAALEDNKVIHCNGITWIIDDDSVVDDVERKWWWQWLKILFTWTLYVCHLLWAQIIKYSSNDLCYIHINFWSREVYADNPPKNLKQRIKMLDSIAVRSD